MPRTRRGSLAPEVDDGPAVLNFASAAGRLKVTVRSGWIQSGVGGVESVADHSHRVALLAMVGAEAEGLDSARAVAMALVHDLAEASVGDMTPRDGVSREDKSRLERGAIDGIGGALSAGGGPCAAVASRVRSLWASYESASDGEARLVKDCDKLEMCIQALEYEVVAGSPTLGGFFDGVPDAKLHTAWARRCMAEVRCRRALLFRLPLEAGSAAAHSAGPAAPGAGSPRPLRSSSAARRRRGEPTPPPALLLRSASTVAVDTGASLRADGFVPGPCTELGAEVARVARAHDPAGAVTRVDGELERAFVAQAVRVYRPLAGFRGEAEPSGRRGGGGSPGPPLRRALSSPFSRGGSGEGTDSLGLPLKSQEATDTADRGEDERSRGPSGRPPSGRWLQSVLLLLLGALLGAAAHAHIVAGTL